MKRLQALLALAVLVAGSADLGAVPDRPDKKKKNLDPVKEEYKRLEGVWNYAVSRGDLHVTIRNGVYTTVDSKGNVSLSAFMKIDPTKKPKWLDMVYRAGAYKGQTLTAIYELKGDTLTLCIQVRGNGRPSVLRGDSNYDLCTLRRAKK